MIGCDANGLVREETVVKEGSFKDRVRQEVVKTPDEEPIVFLRCGLGKTVAGK